MYLTDLAQSGSSTLPAVKKALGIGISSAEEKANANKLSFSWSPAELTEVLRELFIFG